jgi:peptidoglycan/xylan/chitin deacetylase (PgdA/CDA1 family)
MEKFTWPGGCQAAVTISYDDGLITQLENAMPQLDGFGIRATFFPSGDGLTDPSHIDAWRAAAAKGHEIGAHTIHHPCDRARDFVREGFSLQDYSPERMREELGRNLDIIRKFGFNPDGGVFAYPCGESLYGEGLTQSYKPIIKEMFSAARGVTEDIADPVKADLYDVPCFGVTCGAEGMIEIAERARASGSWAVILFHGVGGDYISVETKAHEGFLKYLVENRDTIWTAPFGEISGFISKNRKTLPNR